MRRCILSLVEVCSRAEWGDVEVEAQAARVGSSISNLQPVEKLRGRLRGRCERTVRDRSPDGLYDVTDQRQFFSPIGRILAPQGRKSTILQSTYRRGIQPNVDNIQSAVASHITLRHPTRWRPDRSCTHGEPSRRSSRPIPAAVSARMSTYWWVEPCPETRRRPTRADLVLYRRCSSITPCSCRRTIHNALPFPRNTRLTAAQAHQGGGDRVKTGRREERDSQECQEGHWGMEILQ